MSHLANEQYVENAAEHFNQCVDTADYEGAKRIILQLYREGFSDQAAELEKQLLAQPIGQFHRETIMSLWHKIENGAKELKRLMDEPPYKRDKDGLKQVDQNTWLK